MFMEDTIAAIATAAGEGSIAVVRISGPEAFAIADRVIRCPPPRLSARPTHTIIHGYVADTDQDIDEVLVLVMRAPRTYTGEDVVEIQGHGGRVLARRILHRVLQAGARSAEPGEFTKRAFLNGRIDLLQAEAVLDLVRARSDRAASVAFNQLQGTLSRQVNEIYSELLAITSDFEATLDFPEDDFPAPLVPAILQQLHKVSDSLNQLLATWNEGRLLREGIAVVISGNVNVGKSTLFNTLIGNERAITSPIPGTTRDYIEEEILIDGIPVRVIDTAGLRPSSCAIEQEGIRRSHQQIRNADLQLHVLDASVIPNEEERRFVSSLDSRRCILVLNKIDLGFKTTESDFPGYTSVQTCLLTGSGVAELREVLRLRLQSDIHSDNTPNAAISERHFEILSSVARDVSESSELLASPDQTLVVPALAQLRHALELLGLLNGRIFTMDLLDSIFSKFCIGK